MSMIADLKSYDGKVFRSDLIAGLTVAVVLVPQSMAYALLAGMPPVFGLYAALVPMMVYPIFSSSRTLSVGPVALMSIVVLSGASVFATPGTQQYIDIVLMSAFLSGVLQVLFGLLRFGVLANFLSKPVMVGFVSAAGVIIAISQIKYFLTLNVPRSPSVLTMMKEDFVALDTSNMYSLFIGLLGLGVILGLKKVHRQIPRYIIAAIVGILLSYFTRWYEEGVPIVGDFQDGIPGFYSGFFEYDYLISLLPSSLIIGLICFIGSFAIAKTVGESRDVDISANRELISLGLAKVIGSFFQAMPSTGSFTRTAVNVEAGAITGMASVICAIFIGLTLAFLSPYFYYLPEPILAAIVITSVFSLINVSEAKKLWKLDRSDFWVGILTFLLTLILGIVNGILVGIALSLLSVIMRSSKPHFAELGRLPGTNSYRNVLRYKEAQTLPEVLILRYDQDLFFGNADHFYQALVDKIRNREGVQHVVLHLGAINNMDSTALDKVERLIEYCRERGVVLTFTNLSGPIRDLLQRSGIFEKMGKDHFYLSVAHAVQSESYSERLDRNLSNIYAHQSKSEK